MKYENLSGKQVSRYDYRIDMQLLSCKFNFKVYIILKKIFRPFGFYCFRDSKKWRGAIGRKSIVFFFQFFVLADLNLCTLSVFNGIQLISIVNRLANYFWCTDLLRNLFRYHRNRARYLKAKFWFSYSEIVCCAHKTFVRHLYLCFSYNNSIELWNGLCNFPLFSL